MLVLVHMSRAVTDVAVTDVAVTDIAVTDVAVTDVAVTGVARPSALIVSRQHVAP